MEVETSELMPAAAGHEEKPLAGFQAAMRFQKEN
jgi:hypothetical protein